MAVRKITREKFLNWLQSHDKDDLVGSSLEAVSCPIACFYNQYEVEDLEVQPDYVTFYIGDKYVTHQMPMWARNFIYNVDSIDEYPISVRADKAVEILRKV